MVWVGSDLKDHLIPIPLQWAGTPSTTSGCSKPHPTWSYFQGSGSMSQVVSSFSQRYIYMYPLSFKWLYVKACSIRKIMETNNILQTCLLKSLFWCLIFASAHKAGQKAFTSHGVKGCRAQLADCCDFTFFFP